MENQKSFVLKGNILYTPNPHQLLAYPHSYIVCEANKVAGVFNVLPPRYEHLPLIDYGEQLILPGLVDLHLHAPQYAFRGSGMDMELLPWLNTYAFAEEGKYQENSYADKAYTRFVKDLSKSATTHAAIFSTLHVEGTHILMSKLEQFKIQALVGKVNMDQNSPSYLCEQAQQSLDDTEQWINSCVNQYKYVKPIITPRFTPSCSPRLLEGLGKLASQYHLPVQSHLSENPSEIAWVKELHPDCSCYGASYAKYNLFGNDCPTIMAHCVHCSDEEIDLLQKNNVYVAHCPQSNMNLSSGIAPIRKLLNKGVHVGLGTDIAAGFSLSLFRAMSDTIQLSKLYFALVDHEAPPLTVPEVFYMATKEGGSFFGKVGSFEEGYEFHALVMDDSSLGEFEDLTLEQRLEHLIYLSDDRNIVAKYILGENVLEGGN